MGKRLEVTPKIAAAIARSTDGSVDPATVAVFQTSALNTLPVNKKGTLFDQGRISETTLRQMADYLNAGTNFAPLHLVHDQTDGALPVGRVFAGEVVSNEGVAELHNLFYLPLSTGAELIEKLETSVIDEVSVGLSPLHLNCSECGFDYLGSEATWENIYYRQCPSEHQVGEKGVHTITNGMGKYNELSLVSRGAAQNTKILSRAKALMASMGKESYSQLVASGKQPELVTLFASTNINPKEKQMDLTVLVGELTTAKASVLQKDADLIAANATIVTLTTGKTELEAKVVELTAAADTAGVAPLQAKLTAAEATATAALTFVRTEAERLAVAAGLEKPAADATLEVMTASITAARTKLQETLPVNGATLSAKNNAGNQKVTHSNNSFKTR